MPYEADYQLIAIIASSTNQIELAEALLPVAQILECKDFSLVLCCQRPLVPDLFYAFSSNSQWAKIYLENSLHSEDPIFHKSSDQPLAFIWSHDHQPKVESQFWSLTEAFNFENGYAIPLHFGQQWSGYISFNSPKPVSSSLLTDSIIHKWLNGVVASVNHVLMQKILPAVMSEAIPKLSKREIECLGWAASGKTSWEIAGIMTLSEATVVFHLNNLIRKLKVKNRTQAIAVGMSLGLLANHKVNQAS